MNAEQERNFMRWYWANQYKLELLKPFESAWFGFKAGYETAKSPPDNPLVAGLEGGCAKKGDAMTETTDKRPFIDECPCCGKKGTELGIEYIIYGYRCATLNCDVVAFRPRSGREREEKP